MIIPPRGSTEIQHGDGWTAYRINGEARIAFNHKPDPKTLAELRAFASWSPLEQAWRAHGDYYPRLLAVGRVAVTWESVGEDPPSMYDAWDGPAPW